jgi:hypothetical protein
VAPLYWGIKGADEGEKLYDGEKDILQEVREAMQMPYFLEAQSNEREVFGSPEFWLNAPNAGAQAHMDAHCESTLGLQLSGTRRWRLSWPPQAAVLNEKHLFTDGKPYKAVGGWKPAYSFTVSPGETIFMPAMTIHETKNIGSSCANSLTFQFNDPTPGSYMREFFPRLRRTGDFVECVPRIASLATLGLGKKKPPRRGEEASTAADLWQKILKKVDKDRDGQISFSEARKSGQTQADGVLFGDLNNDDMLSREEFVATYTRWAGVEAEVSEEKADKKKKKWSAKTWRIEL